MLSLFFQRGAALLPILWLLACASPPLSAGAEAVARAGFGGEEVGYTVFDIDSGAILAERQPDTAFLPASVAKLPTMAAAIALLGPEHRFITALFGTGPVTGGVLRGNLILKGGGDPSLATEDLQELAAALRARGVRRIAGRFLFDITALPELPEIDTGQPWTAGYNAGVGALSLNFNRVQRVLTLNGTGEQRAEFWSVSDVGRYALDGTAVDAEFFPTPSDAPERVWLPVRHPGLVAATVFRQVATEAGIALPTPATGLLPARASLLAAHESAPLAELARNVLRYSNNLSAELIGLAAARRIDPELDLRHDTLSRSAAVLAARLATVDDDADWNSFQLANHSGLTSASRVTPRQMAALLRAAGPALWDLLPGKDEGKALANSVRAKSGTLAYASALAGTLRTASGRWLGFALFVADSPRRRELDATMDRSVAEMPAEARAWLVRARNLQAELLAHWAARF